jgi:hypothetical protein
MRAPRALAQPPLSRGAACYGGAGWLGGRERKRGFGAALWGAARFSGVLPAARASAGPPLPVLAHPAPSRRLGFTVIQLGAFTALTLGLEHKSLARGSLLRSPARFRRRSREASSTLSPRGERAGGWPRLETRAGSPAPRATGGGSALSLFAR